MKIIEIKGDNRFSYYDKIRTACRSIIIKEDMVLLSHARKYDIYMLPGGGLEDNETERECAIREVEEETGYIIDTDECILEIDEYYEDYKFITKYFVGIVIDKKSSKYTLEELSVGMESLWMKVNEIRSIFSSYNSYKDTFEEKRGIYLREFKALEYVLKNMKE